MTTLALGLIGTVGLVGFGTSVSGISAAGSTINLTGTALGPNLNYAFRLPRNGTIRDISAMFSLTVGINLVLTTATINVQLYRAPSGSNTFTPLVGTNLNLAPTLTGPVALGFVATGDLTNINIAVTRGDRLLLVGWMSIIGVNLVNTVTGYLSAGVHIT